MGKRCIAIECAYLANDGTCLLKDELMDTQCPALEKKNKPYKDEEYYYDYGYSEWDTDKPHG